MRDARNFHNGLLNDAARSHARVFAGKICQAFDVEKRCSGNASSRLHVLPDMQSSSVAIAACLVAQTRSQSSLKTAGMQLSLPPPAPAQLRDSRSVQVATHWSRPARCTQRRITRAAVSLSAGFPSVSGNTAIDDACHVTVTSLLHFCMGGGNGRCNLKV